MSPREGKSKNLAGGDVLGCSRATFLPILPSRAGENSDDFKNSIKHTGNGHDGPCGYARWIRMMFAMISDTSLA